MNKKILFTDLDGTLLNDGKEITKTANQGNIFLKMRVNLMRILS